MVFGDGAVPCRTDSGVRRREIGSIRMAGYEPPDDSESVDSDGYTVVVESIYIKEPEIFGGDARDGGVQGCADWINVWPNQEQSAHLRNQLGDTVPAFHGVSSLV